MEEMPAEGELSDGRKETLEEEWSPPRVLIVRQRRRIRLRPLAIAV